MKVTFLGTGTSQGVPIIGCNCEVCTSSNMKDARLRSSISIEIDNKTYIVDAGPDFRQQMLRENFKKIDAILLTHAHKDHTGGLDDIRPFNFMSHKAIDIYCEKEVEDALKREYSYVFSEHKYPGIPEMSIKNIDLTPFSIYNHRFIPIRVLHMNLPILGFRLLNFAYITDASHIDNLEIEKLKGVDVLVVNAVRKQKHYSHFNIEDAIHVVNKVSPKKAYFTHISHSMGLFNETSSELPHSVYLAYDGLKIEV